jgi:hypothetical protein
MESGSSSLEASGTDDSVEALQVVKGEILHVNFDDKACSNFVILLEIGVGHTERPELASRKGAQR